MPALKRVSDLPAVHHDRRIPASAPKQLDDTRALIARAEADGHTRMVEMNRTVETNLLTLITALDADRHNCQCTARCGATCCGKESSDAQ